MAVDLLLEDEEATLWAGKQIARQLAPGSIVLLNGELGTGKTTLTRGIARGLGIKRRVVSPTFAIVNVYPGTPAMYHFDFYRVLTPEQVAEIGFDEYVSQNGVIIVEWPERMGHFRSYATHEIHLFHQGDQRRLQSETLSPFPQRMLK